MCILIASTDGSLPTIEQLIECERSNPHGIGIAWGDGSALSVRKALALEEFLPMLQDKPDDAPYVLHFRYATHGEVSLANCHPFTVGGGTAMAHNGILPWRSSEKRSDSRCFARDIIRPNRRDVWDSTFQAYIEDFIGNHNKLAFVDKYGQVAIYNEHCGHWSGNIWFSNYSYRSYSRLSPSWMDADDCDGGCGQASADMDEAAIDGDWTVTDAMFRDYHKKGEI